MYRNIKIEFVKGGSLKIFDEKKIEVKAVKAVKVVYLKRHAL